MPARFFGGLDARPLRHIRYVIVVFPRFTTGNSYGFPGALPVGGGRRLRFAADAARLQLVSGNLVRRAVLKRKVQHLGEKICFNTARDDAREVMLNSVFEPGPAPHGL
jgi:hypothetical protein